MKSFKALTVLAIALIIISVPYAYSVRGYFAVGGEWIFVFLPLICLILG